MALNLIGKVLQTLRLPTTDYAGSPIQIVSAEQGDLNSRYLKVIMYDKNGNVDMTPYEAVLFQAENVSGDSLAIQGEIQDGAVFVSLSPEMLHSKGKLTCKVIVGGEEGRNNLVLTSQTFYVYVAI